MARTFITKSDVSKLADSGQRTVVIGANCTITDVAIEYARARGMQIQRGDGPAIPQQTPAAPAAPAAPAVAPSVAPEDASDAVRAAVIAKLGASPADLDAVIAKVLSAQP